MRYPLKSPSGMLAIVAGAMAIGISFSLAGTVPADEQDRSPVDLALLADDARLITVNQTSDTVSLVDAASGKVLHEVACGHHPSAIALTSDKRRALVSATYAGTVTMFDVGETTLSPVATIDVRFEP